MNNFPADSVKLLTHGKDTIPGNRIWQVSPHLSADEAGLLRNDVILRVNGLTLKDSTPYKSRRRAQHPYHEDENRRHAASGIDSQRRTPHCARATDPREQAHAHGIHGLSASWLSGRIRGSRIRSTRWAYAGGRTASRSKYAVSPISTSAPCHSHRAPIRSA